MLTNYWLWTRVGQIFMVRYASMSLQWRSLFFSLLWKGLKLFIAEWAKILKKVSFFEKCERRELCLSCECQLFVYIFFRQISCLFTLFDWSIRNQNNIFFKIFTHCALTWGSKGYSAKIQHFFLISLICFGLRPLAKWSLLQFSFFVLHAHKLICLQAIIHTQCLKIISVFVVFKPKSHLRSNLKCWFSACKFKYFYLEKWK